MERFSFSRGGSGGVANDETGENAEGDCPGDRRNWGDRLQSGSGVLSPSGEGTSGTSMASSRGGGPSVVMQVPRLVIGTVTCEATVMSPSSTGRLAVTAATDVALIVRLGVRSRCLLLLLDMSVKIAARKLDFAVGDWTRPLFHSEES